MLAFLHSHAQAPDTPQSERQMTVNPNCRQPTNPRAPTLARYPASSIESSHFIARIHDAAHPRVLLVRGGAATGPRRAAPPHADDCRRRAARFQRRNDGPQGEAADALRRGHGDAVVDAADAAGAPATQGRDPGLLPLLSVGGWQAVVPSLCNEGRRPVKGPHQRLA